MTIAVNLQAAIEKKHDIKLNAKRLKWGSISPDFLPKYKIYRHYKDESIHFVVNEIIGLIYFSKLFNLKRLNKFTNKIISTKIGVVSHFLCDYVCLPHCERWTCDERMKDHMMYEKKLNKYASSHEFDSNCIKTSTISYTTQETVLLKDLVENYINQVVEEYREDQSFERDLDFGLALTTGIADFIIETVFELQAQTSQDSVFVF